MTIRRGFAHLIQLNPFILTLSYVPKADLTTLVEPPSLELNWYYRHVNEYRLLVGSEGKPSESRM